MIDKISPDMLLKHMEQLQSQADPTKAVEEKGGNFKDMLGQLIQDVDHAQKAADVSLENLATGENASIQEVVSKIGEAEISFQLMKEIRDKLLDAYKEVLSMNS